MTLAIAVLALVIACIALVGSAIHAGLTPTTGPVHADPNRGPFLGPASDMRAFMRAVRAWGDPGGDVEPLPGDPGVSVLPAGAVPLGALLAPPPVLAPTSIGVGTLRPLRS